MPALHMTHPPHTLLFHRFHQHLMNVIPCGEISVKRFDGFFMSFHTSECDRTVPDELSLHSAPYGDGDDYQDQSSSRNSTSNPNRSGTATSVHEFRQPLGDEDDAPIRDDLLTSNEIAKMRRSPKLMKTPLPQEFLRTSVSPRAKQQFVRFENDFVAELQADLMARTSPKNSAQNPKLIQPIDMRLKSNMVHIGGCWGSVDLS